MNRIALRSLVLALCLCAFLPSAHADEFEDEQARTIEALHAFGVRGLPGAYAHAHESVARTQAIEAGLRWLAAHRTDEGTWRPGELYWCHGKEKKDGAPTGAGKNLYTTGVTGMVVVAFLGAGYTHRGKHPYAEVVRKALAWLVEHQDKEGCVGPRTTQQYVYNHAFGTLALVEAYALTGDPKLRTPAQKALDFSALARNPYLAWRYGVKPGDNDTSITGCMGMPLYVALRLNRAGERAHVFEPLGIDDTVFDGIRNWLDKVTDEEYGNVGYVMKGTGPARPQELVDEFPGEKSEACTAIATLMRLVVPPPQQSRAEAKQSKDLIEKGVGLMLDLKPAWTIRGGNIDLYYWYYATMAMRQVGGDAWSTWDEALAQALLGSQHKVGEPCGAAGSWDPAGVWAKADGGRIYATAMCVLMLETPDRMRPLPADRSDLLEALDTQDVQPDRRATILRGLGLLEVPKSGAEVAKWVGHDDAAICAAAAEALGRLDAGRKGVKVLADLLDDERLAVRRAAVGALARQGPHLRPVIDDLLEAMTDKDLEVAAGAARALGACGVVDVAGVLKPRMKDGDITLRVAAAAAVFHLTKETGGPLPVLVEGLGAKSPRVRLEAAETLERMEGADLAPAEKALVVALADEHAAVGVHAAGALLFTAGKSEHRAACLAAWIAALDSRSGRDRTDAMVRLARLGDPAPTPKLAAQLLTGPTSLRIQAAKTLAAAGQGARPAAATLSWCSANGPSALRKAASDAYDALAIGPQEAVRHLLPVFDTSTPDPRLLEGAARALVFQGGAIVPPLVDKLATGKATAKRWTLEVFRRLGRAAAPAVEAIARQLRGSEDHGIKRLCIRALAAIGPAAAKALPALEEALQHESWMVHTAAIEAIGALANDSEKAVGVLMTTAANKDPKRRQLRMTSLRALGSAEEHADRIMPALLMTMEDADRQVRDTAIEAVAELWPASQPYLEQALEEAGPKVRNGAAHVIARIGAPAKKLVKPLARVLEHGNFTGETPYADALGAIGKPSVRSLMKLLRSDASSTRGEAARALGIVGPDAKRALNSLRKLLSDQDFNVQIKARAAIDKIKPPKRR